MKQFAVLGLGQFGRRVASSLADAGQDVIAIDADDALVGRFRQRVGHAVCADVTDEDAMEQIGLDELEAAVVAVGTEQLVAILATAILRKLGVTRIVARATSQTQGRILRMIGANEVVYPEDEIGRQLADRLVTPGYFEVGAVASGRRIVEIGVLPDWVGRTLGEVGFRAELGAAVLAIKRKKAILADTGETETEEVVNDLPGASDRLEEGDVVLLLALEETIATLRAKA